MVKTQSGYPVPYAIIHLLLKTTNYVKFVVSEDLPSCLQISIIDSELVP